MNTGRPKPRPRESWARARPARTAAPAVVIASVALLAAPPHAAAAPAPCPDIEVIVARGTFEAPGPGGIGQGFIDALRARAGARTVEAYPVNYPASLDFARAADGVLDAANHARDTATRCPATQIVLPGYSQGAAIAAYLTSDSLPAGYALPAGISDTLPANVRDQISAVALFGTPSPNFLALVYRDAPPITIGTALAAKTIDLCAPGDPVCGAQGADTGAHSAYLTNDMINQAADFAVNHLHQT